MSRLLLLLLACLFRGAGAQAQAAVPPVPPERVNVVLIVWNDVPPPGPGLLGGGEDPALRSSALEALAAQGALFVDGLVPLPRGRPALTSLVTGTVPHRNGVYYQKTLLRIPPTGTLARLLKEAGYATLEVGRFPEGKNKERFGFDRVLAEELPASDEPPEGLVQFLDEHAGQRPLFVWWAPRAPAGAPALAPQPVDAVPAWFPEELEAYREERSEHARATQALGAALDGLVRLLEQRGLAESTLFCFVTDEDPPGNTFRARDLAEPSVRSPIFFTLPGRIPASVLRGPVSFHDLFPTILDYAGVPLPPGSAGRSLRAELESGSAEPRTVCGGFYPPYPEQGAGRGPARDVAALLARDERFKYVLYLQDVGVRIDRATETITIDRSAGDQSLFDLEADPYEERDLFGEPEHAQRLRAMREAALEWWRSSGGGELIVPYLPPGLGPPPKESRPNIVLVIADDQDNEHLGFLGNTLVKTPALDSLARSGAVFPVAHVPMSRCRPSLATLLSGRWPHQNGIYDNETNRTLSREDSLPNLLKAAGYAAFQGGKFWEGSHFSMGFLAPRTVDAVFRHFVRDDQDELFAFIDEFAGKRPLFLWWAPMLPHGPFNPPERYQALFRDTEIPVPPWIQGDPEEFRRAERTSFAMEAWFDDGLGALCDKLKEAGIFENTLFVFLIDNGWSNGLPAKGSVFEKGLATPIFFSWPAKIAGGRTLDGLVSSIDLYPTILDYAGVAVPEGAQGISLRPLLEGKELATREVLHGAVYRYRERPGPIRAEKDVYALYARTERWKYVLYLADVLDPDRFMLHHEFAAFPARKRGDRDLFDLEADPHELHDLSGDPERRALMDELQAGILAWWTSTGGGELDLP